MYKSFTECSRQLEGFCLVVFLQLWGPRLFSTNF
nr:MAG TPA: hypothetical protein [Caudoviricetes sp.]